MKHGGDLRALAASAGCTSDAILDCSANLNPLGPPDWLEDLVLANIPELARYPDPAAEGVVAALAAALAVPAAELVVGNGASELLHLLPLALRARRVVVPQPAYIGYRLAAEAFELPLHLLPARSDLALDLAAADAVVQPGDCLFVAHPANPSGLAIDEPALRRLVRRHPQVQVVVDESFLELAVDLPSLLDRRPDNLLVLRSLTKTYAIPGLRIGFVAAEPQRAAAVRRCLPDWSVNALAQATAIRALAAEDYRARSRSSVALWRKQLIAGLERLRGLHPLAGAEANYLCVACDPACWPSAPVLAQRLLTEQRVAIRACGNMGLDPRWIRLAVRPPAEQAQLLSALTAIA